MYEDEWNEWGMGMPLEKVSLIASCTGGFCGYKTVWMDLAVLISDLEYCNQLNNMSAVSWPVIGRFSLVAAALDDT